jgi:hypothetical protein
MRAGGVVDWNVATGSTLIVGLGIGVAAMRHCRRASDRGRCARAEVGRRRGLAPRPGGRIAKAAIATGPEIGRATVSPLEYGGAAGEAGWRKSLPGFA